MNKQELLGQLKKALAEVPELRKQNYSNGQLTQWRDGVLHALQESYGLDSSQYLRFEKAPGKSFIVNTELGKQQDYEFRIDCYESALKTLIDRAQMSQ